MFSYGLMYFLCYIMGSAMMTITPGVWCYDRLLLDDHTTKGNQTKKKAIKAYFTSFDLPQGKYQN